MKKIICILVLLSVIGFAGKRNIDIQPVLANNIQAPINSPEYVKEYVAQQAKVEGVNVQKVLWILNKESQDGQRMTGDDGMSRGYFMIDRKYHPEVSDACAMDLKCSLQFALNLIKSGQINQFSTYKFCRKFYPDCPF